MSPRGIVIALCNESTYAVAPWAWTGYTVYMVDPLHPVGTHPHPTLPNTWTIGAIIEDCLSVLGVIEPVPGRDWETSP